MGGSKGRARCPHRARPGRGKTLRNLLKPHHGALNSYIQKSDNLAKISERGSVSRSVMAGNDVLNFPGTPCHAEMLRVEDPRSFGFGCAGLRTPRPASVGWLKRRTSDR